MTAPAFAAPRRDDSPIGAFERAITRIAKIVRQILPLDVPIAIDTPKP
jgi:hypothetical protein